MATMAPLGVRLKRRVALTVIFAVATAAAFVVGRFIVAFVTLGFLAVSIGLLVLLVRERRAADQ